MVYTSNGTDAASTPLAGLTAFPHGITLDNTYGAVLLGTFFALILYGVLLHQLYTYLCIHSEDSIWIKSYVAFIAILDTVHSVLIICLCYLKLVKHFLDISYLVTVDWPQMLWYAKATSHIGFTEIIYQVAGLGLAIAFTVKAFQAALWTALSQYAPWISVVLGIAVFVDTILAAVLVLVLHRSRTKVASTNLSSVMDKLIAYAVTTGLLTDVCNILGFVFALASSHYLYYAAANMLGTKVYTNSVLAALNFRRPREPAESHNTGPSTPTSHSREAALGGSKASANTPKSFLDMESIDVKV